MRSAFNSILKQKSNDYEVLIIDGGSKDDTIDIVKGVQATCKLVRYISESDKGIYDAMNKGVDLALGDWLYFLGSDDQLYDSNVLKDISGLVNTGQYNILYGDVQIVGDTSWAKDGEKYDGEFDLKKMLKRNICHQSIFYRREFIKKNIGYYNIAYKLCADWDFNLRCRSKTDFLYLPKVVARFNGGGESTDKHEDENFSRDFLKNILSYFNITVFDPLINNTEFSHYHEVLLLQKRYDYIRYLTGRVKKKINRLI